MSTAKALISSNARFNQNTFPAYETTKRIFKANEYFHTKTLEFLISLHSTKNFNRYRKSIRVNLVYSSNVRSFEGLHNNSFSYHDYIELICYVHTARVVNIFMYK